MAPFRHGRGADGPRGGRLPTGTSHPGARDAGRFAPALMPEARAVLERFRRSRFAKWWGLDNANRAADLAFKILGTVGARSERRSVIRSASLPADSVAPRGRRHRVAADLQGARPSRDPSGPCIARFCP